MELENLNPTAPETASGGQAGAVAPQTETPTDAAGRESVVGSYHNSDFDLVDTDAGEGGTSGTGDGNAARPAGRDGKGGGADAPDPDGADRGGADSAKEQTIPEGIVAEAARSAMQTRGENAAMRAARLRGRQEAEAELRAQMDAEIAQMGLADPYNEGRRLSSFGDLRAYSQETRRRELEAEAQRTGRSVDDLTEDEANRRFLSAMRMEAEQQATMQRRQTEQQDFLQRDVLDFVTKYPQFGVQEVAALEQNQQFRQFCGSRFGRESLAKLYGDYLALVGSAGKAAVNRETGKAARSTGGGGESGVMLTPTQKNALDAWNADHPEMAMTAKEFLGR